MTIIIESLAYQIRRHLYGDAHDHNWEPNSGANDTRKRILRYIESEKIDLLASLAYQGADAPKAWVKSTMQWNTNVNTLLKKLGEADLGQGKPPYDQALIPPDFTIEECRQCRSIRLTRPVSPETPRTGMNADVALEYGGGRRSTSTSLGSE